MTPTTLERLSVQIVGRDGWQTKIAGALEKSPRTIRRWYAGDTEIDGTSERLLRELAKKRRGR